METYSSSKTQSWLSWFLRGILILGFFILIARLFDLQVIRGSYFRDLAEGNRIRRVPIVAPRGKILSRGGEVLVGNKEVKKRVLFFPDKGYEKTLDIKNAPEDETIVENDREYLLGGAFAHVSGYLGEVNEKEVGKVDPACPEKGIKRLGGRVGRTGLEERYDCLLKGIDGEELIEVDSMGKMLRIIGRRDPVPGSDLKTSINYQLQEFVSTKLGDKKGAVIVTTPDGQVLGLFSSPSFNPNYFIQQGRGEEIEQILSDINFPLFNRATGGIFHPGSVIKPIIAISALETGKIDRNFKYTDSGSITIKSIYGDFTYNNWYFTQYGGTEGEIGITRAIARSTDTFFYKVGELVGIELIDEWLERFGLDEKTGIDLPGEIPGLVPSPQWKEKVKGERWFLGNTYHISIGQGDLAVTPISINTAISAIANGGKLCRPQVGQIESWSQSEDDSCVDLGLNKNNMDIVKEGMVTACKPAGTGFTFFDTSVDVACKTGTAQTSEEKDPHAWFTFFAPEKAPEIVVTVLVENGGEGSRVAGPIARDIYNFWFTE